MKSFRSKKDRVVSINYFQDNRVIFLAIWTWPQEKIFKVSWILELMSHCTIQIGKWVFFTVWGFPWELNRLIVYGKSRPSLSITVTNTCGQSRLLLYRIITKSQVLWKPFSCLWQRPRLHIQIKLRSCNKEHILLLSY